jgi:hypothetical protein
MFAVPSIAMNDTSGKAVVKSHCVRNSCFPTHSRQQKGRQSKRLNGPSETRFFYAVIAIRRRRRTDPSLTPNRRPIWRPEQPVARSRPISAMQILCVSRCRCAGSGCRACFVARFTSDTAFGDGEAAACSARLASSSSSFNSNCSISQSNFSDLRPNSIRRSLATSSFSRSISSSREVNCSSL